MIPAKVADPDMTTDNLIRIQPTSRSHQIQISNHLFMNGQTVLIFVLAEIDVRGQCHKTFDFSTHHFLRAFSLTNNGESDKP